MFSPADLFTQKSFRKAMFLHHSTGSCIYGPNGSSVSVPTEVTKYNSSKGFSGLSAVSMSQGSWPSDDNEWEHWSRIFEGKDAGNIISNFYNNYSIIIIKTCYPSSAIVSWGSATDTLQPAKKSVFNYKRHFRKIINVMKRNPNNFYVIWTNAPLVASATNNTQAILSDAFCRWAKDTLEKGKDADFGAFPANVYIFDFFHKLAGTDGKLMQKYAKSSGDSHPNGAATEYVAPQFVTEVFDAAIAYEKKLTSCDFLSSPNCFVLEQNYPNPFNPSTIIRYSIPYKQNVILRIFDIAGKQVDEPVSKIHEAGDYKIEWRASGLSSGLYFYSIITEKNTITKKSLLLR